MNYSEPQLNYLELYWVIRSGFEPETHSLEGCCSIQLSYQTLVGMRLQEETRYTSLACRDSTRKITYVGTQISAYKGNLGAKVLLFFELCK